jgi:hypothetical protein
VAARRVQQPEQLRRNLIISHMTLGTTNTPFDAMPSAVPRRLKSLLALEHGAVADQRHCSNVRQLIPDTSIANPALGCTADTWKTALTFLRNHAIHHTPKILL